MKAIWLLAAVGLKLLPAIVTTVPAGPLSGLLPMIEGDPSITVTALVALVPFSEAVISACPRATPVTAIGALSWVAGTVMLPGTVATVGVLDAIVTIVSAG